MPISADNAGVDMPWRKANASDTDLYTHVCNLVNESITVRRKYVTHDRLNDNLRMYLGDQVDWIGNSDSLDVFVINRIQNAVLAATATQTEVPASIKLQPRETNDPPEWYLKPAAAAALAAVLAEPTSSQILPDHINLTARQLHGIEPIDDDTAQDLLGIEQTALQPVQGPAPIDPATGLPGPPPEPQPTAVLDPDTGEPAMLLTEDDFYLVNDDAVADWEQSILDIKLEQAWFGSVLTENVLNTNVLGYQPLRVSFDPETWQFDFENVQPKRVHLDPGNSLYQHQAYIIYDELISVDEAIWRYPDHEAAIRRSGRMGQIEPDVGEADDWGDYDTDTEFQRPMVVIRTAWLRYQTVACTVAEAVRYGKVIRKSEAVTDDDGQPVHDPQTGLAAENVTYCLRNDDGSEGAEVEPGTRQWPRMPGTRQLIFVGDTKLEDVRCPWANIPVVWNRCKPIPGKPWAQGLPENLDGIQKAINMLSSAFINHAQYYQSPQEMMSLSMFNLMEDAEAAEFGSYPGRRLVVPDRLLLQLGNQLNTFVDPPPIPESLFRFWQFLLELFNDQAGQSDVVRGQSSPDAQSGTAIEALQAAARGLYGYLGRTTQDMLRHIARIMVHMIRDQVPEAELMRCNSRYPIQVVRALIRRAENLDYDIRVEISSASGITRRQEQQEARADFAASLISHETTLEKTGTANPQAEMKRIRKERREQAAPVPAPAPVGSPA